jgi:dTDP-4-amino-4,6-dideoxygalactose transaminase
MEARLRAIYGVLADSMHRKGVTYLRPRGRELASRFIVLAESEPDKQAWLAAFEREQIQAASELEFLCEAGSGGRFPQAERLVRVSFSIPFHPLLEDSQIERMCAVIGSR